MSDDKATTIYLTGLSNQHAVEQQAIETVERELGRYDSYPELHARMQQEITRSREQAKRLETLLSQHGSKPSSTKETVTSVIGAVSGVVHVSASDQVLKDVFAATGFKAYEVASYTALIAMAQAAGASADVATLQRSLDEEKEMAAWHLDHLPGIVTTFVDRSKAT